MTKISLYSCPCYFPFVFAVHTWLLIEEDGKVSRFEKGWTTSFPQGIRSGYVYQDSMPSTAANSFLPFVSWSPFKARCEGVFTGADAARMAACIRSSPERYPYTDSYNILFHNSNGYVKWILAQFPSCGLNMPWNAFG